MIDTPMGNTMHNSEAALREAEPGMNPTKEAITNDTSTYVEFQIGPFPKYGFGAWDLEE